VGVGKEDPEEPIVMTQGGGPHTSAPTGHRMVLLRPKSVERVSQEGPVHQVTGVQQGKCGHSVEARGHQVVVLPHPDHVRVGKVRSQDRVAVTLPHPFTAPALSPWTRNFWMNAKTRTTGIAATTPPAAKAPKSTLNS